MVYEQKGNELIETNCTRFQTFMQMGCTTWLVCLHKTAISANGETAKKAPVR
jgi:hypothetical protein